MYVSITVGSNMYEVITYSKPTVCYSGIVALSSLVYRIWNNGQILTFKVSKQLYQSPQHKGSFASDATACLAAKNRTKQINPLLWTELSSVERFWCLKCLNDSFDTNIPFRPNWVGWFGWFDYGGHLRFSNVHISVIWRANGLKFRS